MATINRLFEVGTSIFQWIIDFWDTLTQPLVNTLGILDPVVGGILNFVLSLFGADIYSVSLLGFIFGFGVSFFLLLHFVKFVLGIIR